MKALAGPPAPLPQVVAARTMLELADDPVDVVMAALRLRDLSAAIPRTGGGLASPKTARAYAVDVVLALSLRGFLNPPRARRAQAAHPRLFEAIP